MIEIKPNGDMIIEAGNNGRPTDNQNLKLLRDGNFETVITNKELTSSVNTITENTIKSTNNYKQPFKNGVSQSTNFLENLEFICSLGIAISGADFTFGGETTNEINLSGGSFRECNFNDSVFGVSDFSLCDLQYSTFDNCTFWGNTSFYNASLQASTFKNSVFKSVAENFTSFNNANLDYSIFTGAVLNGSSFDGSTSNGSYKRIVGLFSASAESVNIKDINFKASNTILGGDNNVCDITTCVLDNVKAFYKNINWSDITLKNTVELSLINGSSDVNLSHLYVYDSLNSKVKIDGNIPGKIVNISNFNMAGTAHNILITITGDITNSTIKGTASNNAFYCRNIENVAFYSNTDLVHNFITVSGLFKPSSVNGSNLQFLRMSNTPMNILNLTGSCRIIMNSSLLVGDLINIKASSTLNLFGNASTVNIAFINESTQITGEDETSKLYINAVPYHWNVGLETWSAGL